MAKRSQHRLVHYEKDQLGCMWGLINIFDFRRGGSDQKMISDRRRGSRHAVGAGSSASKVNMLTDFEEGQGIDDRNGSMGGTADAGKPSVKKLIEEEIFSEPELKQQISSMEIEEKHPQPEPGGGSRKNRKRTNRIRKKSNDIHVHDLSATENLGSENTPNLDINAIMDELCTQIQQKNISCTEHAQHGELHRQSGQKHSDFQEKLSEATKMYITQKFVSKKHLTEDGKIHHSKELMDALQTLISNKELFMELLEDPNSLLAKHVQTLQETMAEKDDKSKSKVEFNDTIESEEFANRKHHNFFRRRMKSPQRKPSKENESSPASNRIVILKPGPPNLQYCETERALGSLPQSHYIVKHNGLGDRSASHFSFTEIKRKLKHAMGKERSGISTHDHSHRFPSVSPNLDYGDKGVGGESVGRKSPSRNTLYTERFPKLSTGLGNGDKTGKGGNCEISMERETDCFSGDRASNIYIEAKKHLSEMLSNGDEQEDFSSRQVPQNLGRILALPEYNFSPLCSPKRDLEHGFVTAQMRFSAHDKVQDMNENTLQIEQDNALGNSGPLMQHSETTSCIPDGNGDDKVEGPNSNPDISDKVIYDNEEEKTVCSVRDDTSSEGDVEVIKTIDIQEEIDVLDSEPSSSSITEDDQNNETSETCDAWGNPECARLESFEESQPLSTPLASPSSSPITSKVENIESEIDGTGRPSPISVLEPLFADDDISPARTISPPAEPPITPLQIRFEEHDSTARDQGSNMKTRVEDLESIFEYCETLLQASGICWDEFCMKSLSSDQLLEPSLFDEVVFFSNQLCHDQKLLFDCINEVLTETYEHYFGCSPWVSFVKTNIRPVPNTENTICEVCEGLEWYLSPHLPPRTLEQIVRKDLAKNGKWMDLRFDTGSIGAEMSEVILGELMEDTLLSCLEQNVGNGFSALSAELKDNESSINF